MSLEYTELDEIKSDYVSINSLNTQFSDLLENDKSLVDTVSNRPAVWLSKWYNDDTIPGYKHGDAVWMNTENLTVFIENNKEQITQTILDSEYRQELIALSSNSEELFNLLKNICTGDNGYRPLYCLGNITDATQLRVSLIDDNKYLPTNDLYWKDCFRLSSETSYKKVMKDMTNKSSDQLISVHIDQYHLPSTTQKYIDQTYLLKSLENLTAKQEFDSHTIINRNGLLEGFDYIISSVYNISRSWQNTDNDNQTITNSHSQWFRIWNSGFYERGGIVTRIQNTNKGPQNKSNTFFNVEFDGIPYDYKVVRDSMYPTGYEFLRREVTNTVDINDLGSEMTYSIQMTPINSCAVDDPSRWFVPDVCEIINITNKGFTVVDLCGTICGISYYTAGYITRPTMLKYKLITV